MNDFCSQKNRGRFIVFEGIDGSGKSTQIKLLADRITEFNLKLHVTREPTDNILGVIIRQMFRGEVEGDNKTIAALFVADRMDHLVNSKYGIVAQLNDGVNVLSDRYYFSSYAYHSDYIDMDWVVQANKINADILRADLTIYLEINPIDSLNRVFARGQQLDIYENANKLRSVHENYLKSFRQYGRNENIAIINANRDQQVIADDIWNLVKPMLRDCNA